MVEGEEENTGSSSIDPVARQKWRSPLGCTPERERDWPAGGKGKAGAYRRVRHGGQRWVRVCDSAGGKEAVRVCDFACGEGVRVVEVVTTGVGSSCACGEAEEVRVRESACGECEEGREWGCEG